jgi:glycosyltransferase involved in cell wall biosynthesis
MSNDRVAVVTRTRQRPLLLARAIASVLGQTHSDWVHVIVNDGGDPGEVEALVARHADAYRGRVTVLHHPAPVGMEAASNAGIAASESTWLAIHDDDDTWRPAFLERTLAAIRAHPLPGCRGAVAWAERVSERIEGDRIIELRRESYNDWLREVELWRLLQQNLFPPISFVFARAALAEVGGFDPTLPVLGDWDFNLRFCARFEIAVVPEHLAGYHHRPPGAAGYYGNTVVDGVARHRQYRAWLINRWLREDLAAGRIGRGVLAAVADDLHALRRHAMLPHRVLRAARTRLRRWLAMS